MAVIVAATKKWSKFNFCETGRIPIFKIDDPMIEIPIKDIEPDAYFVWEEWLALESTRERVRNRFGTGEEALHYWPDDYYEKMEQWWVSDRRYLEPLRVTLVDGVYRLLDGWHRLAISHKNKMPTVPCEIE